uniref:Uncharacterized protein n=1 Tax=Anguilla anguilla TaxID=7936 RepID=A0A0E9SKU5_ANGAN
MCQTCQNNSVTSKKLSWWALSRIRGCSFDSQLHKSRRWGFSSIMVRILQSSTVEVFLSLTGRL